jgi:hypothetical protein
MHNMGKETKRQGDRTRPRHTGVLVDAPTARLEWRVNPPQRLSRWFHRRAVVHGIKAVWTDGECRREVRKRKVVLTALGVGGHGGWGFKAPTKAEAG